MPPSHRECLSVSSPRIVGLKGVYSSCWLLLLGAFSILASDRWVEAHWSKRPDVSLDRLSVSSPRIVGLKLVVDGRRLQHESAFSILASDRWVEADLVQDIAVAPSPFSILASDRWVEADLVQDIAVAPSPFSILASDRWVEAPSAAIVVYFAPTFQYPRLGSLG